MSPGAVGAACPIAECSPFTGVPADCGVPTGENVCVPYGDWASGENCALFCAPI